MTKSPKSTAHDPAAEELLDKLSVERLQKLMIIETANSATQSIIDRGKWMIGGVAALLAVLGLACGKSASNGAVADGGGDAVADDAGLAACPVPDGGAPAGVADDFGPNAKAGSTSSALGQLDLYEVTKPRQLEWVDLYLRADLAGTRVTISVYEAAARNAVFRRLAMIQLDVAPCSGWVGSGPIALSDTLRLTSAGVPWNHFPPPGAIEINGVNVFLNGTDRNADFFPLGQFQEVHPTGAVHRVSEAETPEPGSFSLLAIGVLAWLGRRIFSGRLRAV